MGDNMLMLFWLIAMIVFAGVEAATPTALVSIWFALGALGALIASVVTHSFWIQLVVFLLLSCLCFALLRPLVRRYVTPVSYTHLDVYKRQVRRSRYALPAALTADFMGFLAAALAVRLFF